MTDKPNWVEDAAREIWGLACMGELTSEKLTQRVIDKHMARGDESMGEVVSLDPKPPETTPKWMTAAGNDIMNCISEGDELGAYPSVDDFATIILNHCLDDKGAEKLVEALRAVQECKCKEGLKIDGHCVYCKQKVDTALAEYKELNK